MDKITELERSLNALFDEEPKVTNEKKQEELNTFKQNLKQKRDYLFTILFHKNIPADNNASERSVRPVKTKMKVSGQFKIMDGAHAYTTLYSIVQTTRKKNQNPIQALLD